MMKKRKATTVAVMLNWKQDPKQMLMMMLKMTENQALIAMQMTWILVISPITEAL